MANILVGGGSVKQRSGVLSDATAAVDGGHEFFSTVLVKVICRIAMNPPRSGTYFSSSLLLNRG